MKGQEKILLEKLTQLQDLLVRYGHRGRMARGPMGNPYRGQGRILKLLRLKPEISQRDLLELLDMRPQSLGELLGKLERDGYITRAPLEEDRRVMMIRLTEKGAYPQEEASDEVDLLDCLTGEEQVILEGYLDRMIARLEQVLAEMGPAPHEPPPPHHGHHHGFHGNPPPPHGPHHRPHDGPPPPPPHGPHHGPGGDPLPPAGRPLEELEE